MSEKVDENLRGIDCSIKILFLPRSDSKVVNSEIEFFSLFQTSDHEKNIACKSLKLLTIIRKDA